jgi:cell division protein FtsI/penicillin-binding protein 2
MPKFDLDLNKVEGGSEQTSKPRWRLSSYLRVRLAMLLVILAGCGLILNLYNIQARDGGDLKLTERLAEQNLKTEDVPAVRGQIRTSDGLLLATNVPSYKVYAWPDGMTQKQTDKVVTALAAFLPDVPVEKLKTAFTFTDRDHLAWTQIASDLDDATISKLQKLIQDNNLSGVSIVPTTKRIYPNGAFLGHLLGFAHPGDTEAQGLVGAYGVEGFYDSSLKGQPGLIAADRDVYGSPVMLNAPSIKEPVNGNDLILTIDSGAQYIAERELSAGLKEHKADAGMAIVMNPKTGAILAYASVQSDVPPFDPNASATTKYENLLDPMVSDVYEPGSTFKIFTAAIGIDAGVVQPETSAGNLPGCILKYGARICNWDSQGHSNQTVIDTLRFSSNVGADWIIERIKPEVYYDYMHKLGFSNFTGIDLQGEADGIMPVPGTQWWIPLTYLQNAFGQGIAVTPVQLVTGVSVVANGGKAVRPHVVAEITHDGKVVQNQNDLSDNHQIISPETSQKMNYALTEAMKGAGSETALVCVPGYQVAAKTGTAQIPKKGGGYEDGGVGHTIGSTIAYAPSDNPQVVVYVRYDRPKDTQWGSNTAGPVVHKILSQLLTYYKIPPTEPNTCRYYPS